MAQGGWNPPPGGYAPPPQQPGYPPQQPMYQAPPPGPPPAARSPGGQDKGFFAGLFDFSFETFVALKVIKVLYGLFLLVLGLGIIGGLLGAVFAMISGDFIRGLGMLIALPIGAIIYLVLGRVYFELIIVAFKIAEDADEIAKNTRK